MATVTVTQSIPARPADDRFFGRGDSVIPEDERITYTWENLVIRTKPSRTSIMERIPGGPKKEGKTAKTLLKGVSGAVQPGEVVAIMGSSGSGKTTLLNALTFRNMAGTGLEVVSGERYANGNICSPTSLTNLSAYIQQTDLFLGTLTVEETLQFHSKVRMDPSIPISDRKKRITQVMSDMGLLKCRKTLIGIPGRVKGISGGETKRLAFACELLTNPALLFCDEPTSGLDSYMSHQVVSSMKQMASQGKTVISTIHQPSSNTFALFDKILLMSEGKVAFFGPISRANEFFNNIGLPCPSTYNPADHFVKSLAIVVGQEEECKAKVDHICSTFGSTSDALAISEVLNSQKEFPTPIPMLTDNQGKKSRYRASWLTEFFALISRSWLAMIKEPKFIRVKILQAIVVSLFLGISYLDQDIDQKGVININGGMFFALTSMTMQSMFTSGLVLVQELPIFQREHYNGMYRVGTYILARQLTELPFLVTSITLYTSIFYWLVGLSPSASDFLTFWSLCLLMAYCVMGFGYLLSALSMRSDVAMSLGSTILPVLMLFGGLLINVDDIPAWLSWFEFLSWFRWAYEIAVINQWRGYDTIACETADLGCAYPDGDTVIASMGYDKDKIGLCWVLLLSLSLLYHALAFLVLLFRNKRK